MSEDAKAEAKRIVGDYHVTVCEVADGDTDRIRVMKEQQDRLVAVLAAGFEWREATHRAMERDEGYGDSMTGTEIELLQALSALRARDGEGTS